MIKSIKTKMQDRTRQKSGHIKQIHGPKNSEHNFSVFEYSSNLRVRLKEPEFVVDYLSYWLASGDIEALKFAVREFVIVWRQQVASGPSNVSTGHEKVCLGRDLAVALAGTKLTNEQAEEWYHDLQIARLDTIVETQRLLEALDRLIKPETIVVWFKKRNPAFGGLTPLQVIARGEWDRIWHVVQEMECGKPAQKKSQKTKSAI